VSAPFRASDISRAWRAVESVGGIVRAVEIAPDGTLRLLTDPSTTVPASNDDQDWVALAGQAEISRA
jgi:hypothetical protein